MYKKISFTLAEFIISLTILGVIASLVLPNWINNYNKRQTISRLKIAYSMLDNMISQSYIENGYPPTKYGGINNMDDNSFNTYFLKYLNISKICGYGDDNKKTQGCFKSDENNKDTFYTLDGTFTTTSGYNPISYYKILLKNGMSVGINNTVSDGRGFIFIVDIDGPNKGLSKYGYDIFEFTYLAPEANYSKAFCQQPRLYPGYFHNSNCQLTQSTINERCSENSTIKQENITTNLYPNGSTCSAKIIYDGWKISDDYPWNYAKKKI